MRLLAFAAALTFAAPAVATVHTISLTGTTAGTTFNTFTIGASTYQTGNLILDPFTPFTLEQGDQILATITLNGAFFVPTSGEQLFGINFNDVNGDSPVGPNGSTNAFGTVSFSLNGGATARGGGDITSGACSNCLTAITQAFPGAAFSFDGLGLDETVTGLAAPFDVGQVTISYQLRDVTGNIPEPASWAMLISGFGFVGGVARRRQGATRAVLA
ncbi:hypothetical protein SPAN111604_13750 [Sphingomonas antarctica]|uniref:PEPxxWA-CTERM sorting domain-containing protein n=1 Tax=Sphingomonas antarctica TaxID=2040274 RepID=UPI0039EACE5E